MLIAILVSLGIVGAVIYTSEIQVLKMICIAVYLILGHQTNKG